VFPSRRRRGRAGSSCGTVNPDAIMIAADGRAHRAMRAGHARLNRSLDTSDSPASTDSLLRLLNSLSCRLAFAQEDFAGVAMPPKPEPTNLPAPDAPPPVRAVPTAAQRILHVGCGGGEVGAALKAQDARRQVFGVERHATAAALARRRLDHVFQVDAEAADLPLELGSLDCILYGGV